MDTFTSVGLILMALLTLVFLLQIYTHLTKIEQQINNFHDQLLPNNPSTPKSNIVHDEEHKE